MSKDFEGSVKSKIDYAVFANGELSKEQIAEWLSKDIKGVYYLLAEILNSKEAIDALAEVFYQRYLAFQKAKEVTPELDLKPNGNG